MTTTRRFHVSISVDLVTDPSGALALGIPGSGIVIATLPPGTEIDAADAQTLARAWVMRQGATLSPAEVDRVLARAA